ncbi:hypothetical protein P9112_003641 [Eukaryota sp. TZLM1-RC]
MMFELKLFLLCIISVNCTSIIQITPFPTHNALRCSTLHASRYSFLTIFFPFLISLDGVPVNQLEILSLDFTNVKTLGPVDSDGKVISGCANDEPLITLVKSNVDFVGLVVVGCQSIVATDSTIDLETVLVRDSTAHELIDLQSLPIIE